MREDEFRSRWADYQVDRPQQSQALTLPATANAATAEEQSGLLGAFRRSLGDFFRTGPLQFRADLSSGWEYSNEDYIRNADDEEDVSHSSFFVSPALGVFYNREIGPATVSARYSGGYVYYLDQSYVAARGNGGILSQTGGLDLALEGSRSHLRLAADGSFGNGNDIESGELRDRLQLDGQLNADYQLTEFTQLGATGNYDYTSYSGGVTPDLQTTSYRGNLFADYIFTGKTRLRFTAETGGNFQQSGSTDSSIRYYQGLISANYLPSPKLILDAGLGYGYQNSSQVVGNVTNGSHPIYMITVRYAPTDKTNAALHFGYEGVDVEPDFSLAVNYQPSVNTGFSLSIYQTSGFSTFVQAQNLVTRGALISAQQRLFTRVTLTLNTGVEESSGYTNLAGGQNGQEDPYYFGGITLLWELNSYLAVQAYYRGSAGRNAAFTNNSDGVQSRASMSLRLTF